MNKAPDLTKIPEYYQDKKRKLFLIITFLIFIFLILAADLVMNPYPPKVSFIDGDQYLQGDVYIDDEFVGTMDSIEFGGLPEDYCKGKHKIALDIKLESFNWPTDPTHCTTNLVKFDVKR
ncbi:MAG: hypothetical protein QF824_02970 [Candidatus Woesearchaeota archaeon]|jgi:hypothetical protein|nr:hypothetical protein [Candidatus Woesearchaeota archaeon]|tara:strand:- start:63 stop:422 length:360 start_codon:yes stop_codon:yes gene_type:complete